MSSQWYYQHAGQQLGPISFEQLQIFGASGQLLRTDLVWTEGMADWGEAGETGDIFGSQFQSFSQPAPQQSAPQQMPQHMPQLPAHQSMPQQAAPQQPPPPHTGQPMMPEMYAPQQPFLQEPTPAQPQPAAPMQEPYPQQPLVQEPTSAQQKPAKQQWYFMKGDERCGPISTKQLKRRAANGKLRPTDIVWTEGLDEWIPATKVMGLSFPESQKNTGPRPIPVSKQGGGL